MTAACRLAPLLIVAFATSLSAQSPVQSTLQTARAGNWYLRVTTVRGDTAQGRVMALVRDTVRLGDTRIAIGDVDLIDRRLRRGSGALPAGLFGATVFGLVGLGLSGLCEFDCEHAWVGPTLGGAAMGLALGSVAGAVVSPGRIVWRREHPPGDSVQLTQIQTQEDEDPFAGGGVTFSVGTGWSFEEQRYRIYRFGLQLAGTSRAARPVETTGEFQLLGADGGAALFAGTGANVMMKNGVYAGPVVGFFLSDDATLSVGARAGIRPRTAGLRPEVRADYIPGDYSALLLTMSVGLEVH